MKALLLHLLVITIYSLVNAFKIKYNIKDIEFFFKFRMHLNQDHFTLITIRIRS